MAKYLVLWELDNARIAVDPKERATGWKALMDLVKKDMKEGEDWGSFVGEHRGYTVMEGTEVEIALRLAQYAPWVIFETHAVASISQVDEVHQAMMK